ncbi:CBS domain-containing protein [Planctomycetes bacterium K23_9]|uniref:Magnesium transporter MgtE n=1 Tax=Stieleria marina TaxID=1930275 RepID=A0A517P2X4_9BACT|nr:Magnesium transporter MgtE [Planctomycetes bacterium K23_9]
MSRLKKNEPITHVMTRDLQTINLNTSLSEVGKIFSECNIHHLPVVEGSNLRGMLSYTDLMRVSFADSFGVHAKQNVYEVLDRTTSVEEVMTPDPKTITSQASVREAAEILVDSDFHSLPVVDDGEVVGIVTSGDMLKYLLEQY